jgi:hypothetical protein
MAKPCAHERETLTSNWPLNMDVVALRFHEDGAEVLKALRGFDFLRVSSCPLWWIAVS